MNKRSYRFAVGVWAGTMLLAGCSGASSEGAATTDPQLTTTTMTATTTSTTTTTVVVKGTEVSIENFVFGPSELGVSVGDTIVWTNDESSIGHTATSSDGLWDSKLLSPGDTFEFTFTEAGIFSYFCSIHPAMQASVTVSG